MTAIYDSVLSGFAIELPEQAARALARNPNVRFVEEDAEVWISGLSWSQDTPGGTEGGKWHLDRSDQRQVDGPAGLDAKYGYCSTGQGVYAYIVDTGVFAGHAEVSGRVLAGVDFTEPDPDPETPPDKVEEEHGTASDPCGTVKARKVNGGHGTSVASVLAGSDSGVAKGATLVPVRVLGCKGGGRLTWVLNGLRWINSELNPNRSSGGVVNMSFWFAPVLEDDPNRDQDRASHAALPGAISDLEAAGFAVFVSANNQPKVNEGTLAQPVLVQKFDACATEPSSYSRSGGGKVVTVGGTMLGSDGKRDYRWWTGSEPHQASSYGGCVDIWAPAQGIRVADYTTNGGYWISSGTSFSSPLVAGLAARFMEDYPSFNPEDVWNRIRLVATTKDTTNQNLIREPPNTGRTAEETIPNNRMAYRRDHAEGLCRLRPTQPVSITKQPVSWTLPAGSQVTIGVETDQLADYQWYRGATGDMSDPVWGATTKTLLTSPLASTTSYWVRVDGGINAVHSNAATITMGACPGITGSLSPSMTTIVSGQSLTLTVSASSVNPLTYEWYKDDFYGQAQIPNANASSITVSPTGFTRYTAVLKNGCRTVATNTAHVYVATEHSIAFATYYWNFVGADGGGGSGVHAMASYPYEYERFVLRDLNGGDLVDGDQVTLRSYNGHYVVAEWCGGPGQTVNANRTTAGDWETFSIQNMDGGHVIGHGSRIALRACSGAGYYVVAEYGGLNGGGPGAGDVNCDRSATGEWETFQILWQ